ncbi:MAG: chromosome partitioning protein ParB, chromosome partitioning protein ParB family [Candidatus Parcubacteria bacterium]|jgi:ParB family chromosome partitioning protein
MEPQQPPSPYYSNAIFWVEVHRIVPNPFQPRKVFDEGALADLAESIRQYGVLQPLTVTRREMPKEDGGIGVGYELIAGERRLRAARLAGVTQVPVIIRAAEESDKMKLELAIIENLQREDLNPIDRAKAFKELVEKFSLKHTDVAKKVGKSREYVSNSIRLLALPEVMQNSLLGSQMSEGHARTLLMLADRPEEQETLFKEIVHKKLTVRETERIARRIAVDRARKQELPAELLNLEKQLSESLGTRVQIEPRENGGKVHIDFFSQSDLQTILILIDKNRKEREDAQAQQSQTNAMPVTQVEQPSPEIAPIPPVAGSGGEHQVDSLVMQNDDAAFVPEATDETLTEPQQGSDEDLYSIKGFTV